MVLVSPMILFCRALPVGSNACVILLNTFLYCVQDAPRVGITICGNVEIFGV